MPTAALDRLPAEERCFVVRRTSLEGSDATHFVWLQRALRRYHDQCVGVEGLGRIVADLNALLLARGYVTSRVGLPEQNLASGELRLQLDAGRVEALILRDPKQPLQDRTGGGWRLAIPASAGDILDARDLEQGVEQLRRLPSMPAGIRLEPGSAPNTSRVIVERADPGLAQRVRGGVTLDNAGPRQLGRLQASGNVAVDDPFGLGDLIGASFSTNLQSPTATHRGQSVAGFYSVPWGYGLLTLSASHSRFAQYVQGTTVRFLSSGSSDTLEARWQQVVWRSADTKVGIQAALSARAARSYLDDVEIVVQRRRTTNVEWGVNAKHLREGLVLDADVGVRQGVGWIGAQDDLAVAATGGPTLRPHIVHFSASAAAALPQIPLLPAGLQYSGTLRGQATRDATLATDQFAIGGRYSVRGFTGDTVLLAESGIVLRNELIGTLRSRWGVEPQWFAGFDWGRVSGPSTVFLRGRQLAGAVAGLRGRHANAAFEAALAVPLVKPPGFKAPSPVLTFSLSWFF